MKERAGNAVDSVDCVQVAPAGFCTAYMEHHNNYSVLVCEHGFVQKRRKKIQHKYVGITVFKCGGLAVCLSTFLQIHTQKTGIGICY